MKRPKTPLARLKKGERIIGEGVPEGDLNQKRMKRLKKGIKRKKRTLKRRKK